MKKIVGLLLIILLTGCFNDTAKGNLTSTCTKKNVSVNLTDEMIYEIRFKEDIIEKTKITQEFQGTEETIQTLKESFESSHKYLDDLEELTINVSSLENQYTVIYEIDLNKVTDTVVERFSLKKERSKQITVLKELGFVCK